MKLFKKIDQWVDKFESGATHSADEANNSLAKFISYLAEQHENAGSDKRTLLLTGTVPAKTLEAVTNRLKQSIDSSYTILAGENPAVCATTYELIDQCDAIVLVEEKHLSCTTEVNKLVKILETCNKPILGYIMNKYE